jgi:hypothetical protein
MSSPAKRAYGALREEAPGIRNLTGGAAWVPFPSRGNAALGLE